MSEEFRRKLQLYEEGKLPAEEREEVEREIEKMEAYQSYMDELMGKDREAEAETADSLKEASIIRKGKWKARINTSFTVIGMVFLVMLICSICTNLFYAAGEPNRMEHYKDIVTSTIAVTRPNVEVALSSNSNLFFTMDLHGKMRRQIGDERAVVGDFSFSFVFNRPGIGQMSWLNDHTNTAVFQFPNTFRQDSGQEWSKLEKLPEGTVTEAALSFDRMFTTDELLQQFKNKNMTPVWFAADTGLEKTSEESIVWNPVGFPYHPVWHHDDMRITSYKEQKSGWFGKIVTKGGSYPAIDTYGSGELRNENFMKTLRLLQDYRSITKTLAPSLQIDQTIQYLETNGVKLYGAVVTGPTKEILKLKQEPWVAGIRVGEVRLWNWQDRP
ncbi:anti-sigma factor [Paenibacillus validus]|nr:anti-sigma factor [Paenibacillus validus]MED4602660.1 anti-sigma factor [Paenibacillus validus]MED4608213.1 anti-sigma factor [Paenibacillus validus]